MTREEWRQSREAKRETLRKYDCDRSSRRTESLNTSERFMRAVFGGARIPQLDSRFK